MRQQLLPKGITPELTEKVCGLIYTGIDELIHNLGSLTAPVNCRIPTPSYLDLPRRLMADLSAWFSRSWHNG